MTENVTHRIGTARRGKRLPDYLNEWVARQRWFASKGHVPQLCSIGQWSLPTPEAGVTISTQLVFDTLSVDQTLYQLPLCERTAPLPGDERALIAVDGDTGRSVYDAPHDPAYARSLVRFMLDGGVSAPSDQSQDGQSQSDPSQSDPSQSDPSQHGQAHARGETLGPRAPRATVVSSRVLSGEQSNTSIIIETADSHGRAARPIISKVFRAVHPGANPDVAVQSALAQAGSHFVPQPVGCVVGDWDDPAQPSLRATGHLVFAQEFLPGVEDAWRVALRFAEAGKDFRSQARTLGQATADVHADLARVMPVRETTPEIARAACAEMRDRFRRAAQEVPALLIDAAAIEAAFARAATLPWPRMQRIHGDYHLGQVLHVPGRGWVLVDFEGEPLRPLHERTRLDAPLRDIAGMLRSFAYVAGTVVMNHPGRDSTDAHRWASLCRTAFLEGYGARARQDLNARQALLDAFELDKAVYEAVYESRNRPDWLPIPLAAVRMLAARVAAGVNDRD